jgi:UDP-glucose 4-epimerase
MSIDFRVSKVICLSTDKAVYPINAMGISKAMMEKVAMSKSRDTSNTSICVTRYGNVMGSRGSVIPLFQNQLLTDEITITDPSMTRFMMSMNDAVELVLYAFEHGNSGDLFVQKAPACTIKTLAKTLIGRSLKDNVRIKIIGTRHGEKKHETLLSREEMAVAVDHGRYFKVENDFRDLNYGKFFETGSNLAQNTLDYNSCNTEQLNQDQLNVLLNNMGHLMDE